MIQYTQGDLLKSGADALVNPVNCCGVMGRGLALQFKQKFPRNFVTYRAACGFGEVVPGKMLVYKTGCEVPRYVINFPTKRHWRDKSRLEDIETGLVDLLSVIQQHKILSVAIPALGCGLGGLKWSDVRSLIEAAVADVPDDVHVMVYEPTPTMELI